MNCDKGFDHSHEWIRKRWNMIWVEWRDRENLPTQNKKQNWDKDDDRVIF